MPLRQQAGSVSSGGHVTIMNQYLMLRLDREACLAKFEGQRVS
jgi:hypothetical protein